MYILIAMAIVDAVLLAGTIWLTRRKLARPYHAIERGDGKVPHAL
ncbi:MAG TPA: hypothetical protein VF776_06475 [Sphingomicrobium sp.]